MPTNDTPKATVTRDDERRLDLIVFGATSFAGEILCRHLVKRHGIGGNGSSQLQWAIAGRDASKLNDVARATGAKVERIVADANDPRAMAQLASSAHVIVSTVGPYALYGSELVGAAAAAGTDYCDLTGEPQWIRRMIDEYGEIAEASGARIVHSCGFDSIPSDLGVHVIQGEAIERFGEPCVSIAMRVKTMKGGASGGTVASMMNMMEEAASDAELRKVLANPYALCPEGMRSGIEQPSVITPVHDDASGQWVAPFVMAAINTRVVHRSHALLGRPWGDEFTYSEAMLMGHGPVGMVKASAFSGGLAGFMGLAAVGPIRGLLNRFVLPKPGDGPSVQTQEAGSFDIRLYGETASGERLEISVTGDRDPGYGSTAKMLGEAAFCLVEDDDDDAGGGFWTPSTALGDRLVDRLEDHAGIAFTSVN